MLRAALFFFILAVVGMLLGVTGFAGISIEIGRMLLITFLILAVVSVVGGLLTGRSTRSLP